MVDCGTITIVEERPQYNITDCSVTVREAAPDDELRPKANVENTGNVDGSAELVWFANGQRVADNAADIRAGESTELTGIFTPADVGITSGEITIEVEVQNLQAQSSGLFR